MALVWLDEGQARTNTFAEIAPCPRCQAESDAVSLVRHCQWDGESQVVGCGRGAPCCPELRHRVDLWAVLAEGPDNRRRDPTEALDRLVLDICSRREIGRKAINVLAF